MVCFFDSPFLLNFLIKVKSSKFGKWPTHKILFSSKFLLYLLFVLMLGFLFTMKANLHISKTMLMLHTTPVVLNVGTPAAQQR